MPGRGSIGGGLFALGQALSKRKEKRDREADLLARTQARADIVQSFNDLELRIDPEGTAEDKAGEYRKVIEDRVQALYDRDPQMAEEVEAWGRQYLAPRIANWRTQDVKKHKEQVANTAATRIGQLEKDMLPAMIASVSAETQQERQAAAVRLAEGRKEVLTLYNEVDPTMAEARAGALEVEMAEGALNGIANDFLSKGKGSEFVANLDRGDYKQFGAAMEPAAFAAFRDKTMTRVAREDAAEERRHKALDEQRIAEGKQMVDNAVRHLQSGRSLVQVKHEWFQQGGDTKGWRSVVERQDAIADKEADLTEGRESLLKEYREEQELAAIDSTVLLLQEGRPMDEMKAVWLAKGGDTAGWEKVLKRHKSLSELEGRPIEVERATKAQKAQEDAVMRLQAGRPLEEEKERWLAAGGTIAGWDKVLTLNESVAKAEYGVMDRIRKREEATAAALDAERFKANEQVFDRGFLTLASEEDALAMESRVLDAYANDLISKDWKTTAIQRLNHERQRFQHDDKTTRSEWVSRVTEPLLAKAGIGPMGFIDPQTERSFVEFFEGIEPEIYSVFTQGDRSQAAQGRWRDFIMAAWELSPAYVEMNVLDADAGAGEERRSAQERFLDVVDVIRREGVAADATTQDLMRIIHRTDAGADTTESWIRYDANGAWSEKETARELRYSTLTKDERLDAWLAIHKKVELARTMRGLSKLPMPQEVLAEEKARSELAEAEAARAQVMAVPEAPVAMTPLPVDEEAMSP